MKVREFYIAMPTRGRTDKQYTLKHLCPEIRVFVNVYCHPGELELMQKYRNQVASIQEYGAECKNIGQIRDYIINHSRAQNVIFLDDNLAFHATAMPKDKFLTGWTYGMTEKNYDVKQIAIMQSTMLQWMMQKLKTFAMCGFSFKPFNRDGRGEKINCRLFGIWGINIDKYFSQNERFSDWAVKEDFAIAISLIKHGYDTVCNFDYSFDKSAGANAKGGCSTYRTTNLSDIYSVKLKQKFPECVTIVEKVKNWGEGMRSATMKETIIHWDKIR